MVARCARLAIVVTAACSSKPRTDEAAHRVTAAGDAVAGDAAAGGAAAGDAAAGSAAAGDAAAGSAAAGSAAAGSAAASARSAARATTGDLQIRVEWPGIPVAARVSPGRTPCGTPRAPSVAPTTTWGIPDALVIVDGAPRPTAASPVAPVALADCTLAPRLAAAASLAITSAVDRPAKLVLRNRGTLDHLDHLAAGDPVPVMLPIAGHTVAAALDPGAIYSLETDAPGPELAFIVALPEGRVTDATGHALIRELAPGAHAVTAWLPPRAGQPAHLGRGTAKVTAGELTELTIKLVP